MGLFGLRLRTLRTGKRLTQEDLAEKLGVTKASISRYELSAIYPSVEVLIEISKYFDVSVDYLLGLSEKIDLKMSALTDEQIVIVLGTINEFEKLNALENPVD